MSDGFGQLRNYLDGNDPYVAGGHQIFKTAGATRHAERMAKVPAWAIDDAEVMKIILRAFPKFYSSNKQKQRGLKWLKVINLYYRVGWPSTRIAQELGMADVSTRILIMRINRAADGLTPDGKRKLGKKRGRPKKKSVTIPLAEENIKL